MTLGRNIQKIRKEAHMSQEDLADMFHVSRQTISNWVNNRSYPVIISVILLSDLYQMSLDVLL